MLLRQMRYFAAVVDCGSFTEAAARCYISQSAISQQIRAREQELGTPLIHRENRRFSLTPAGELFYPRCKQLLKEADDLVQEMRSIAAGSGAHLRIGYLRCYSGSELSQAVADFSLCCPEVSISTVSGTHEELYELLRTEKADIILSDQRRAVSDVYVNDELLPGGCSAALSSHDPLAAQDKVSVEELHRLPCILIASAQQQDTEQEYYQRTLEFGGSYLFADDLEEGRLMVISGRGFLPVEGVGTLPAENAFIRRLPLYQNGAQIRRNYCAFWKKERTNAHIETFARTLKTLIQQSKRA